MTGKRFSWSPISIDTEDNYHYLTVEAKLFTLELGVEVDVHFDFYNEGWEGEIYQDYRFMLGVNLLFFGFKIDFWW